MRSWSAWRASRVAMSIRPAVAAALPRTSRPTSYRWPRGPKIDVLCVIDDLDGIAPAAAPRRCRCMSGTCSSTPVRDPAELHLGVVTSDRERRHRQSLRCRRGGHSSTARARERVAIPVIARRWLAALMDFRNRESRSEPAARHMHCALSRTGVRNKRRPCARRALEFHARANRSVL